MREIKFRGRKSERLDKGEWVVGDYWHYLRNFIKNDGADYVIDPNTLGQYTGIRDKKGREIYEGDIVAFTDKPLAERSPERSGPKKPRLIQWKKNGYNLKYINKDGLARGVEVIGNIYENPELLDPQEPTV